MYTYILNVHIVMWGQTVGKSYKSSTSTIPVYPIMLSKLKKNLEKFSYKKKVPTPTPPPMGQ